MRRAPLSALTAALALTLGLAVTAEANAAPDSYVRLAEGAAAGDAGLQTAVAHFRHPEKDVEIVLYGVVHIADADYYARVQRDLDSYDVVLYEGVAPGSTAPTEEDKSLGEMQKVMGEMLGLTFQKDGIDYTRPNLVHADMNMDQLKEAMGGSTINPLGQVMSKEQMKTMLPMLKMAGRFGAMLMKSNPAMRDNFKLMMAKQLGNADLSNALGEKATQAILIERNKVVMEKLAAQLEVTRSGRIAIFYGAAHNPDFEERLAALGFERASKRWMTAWKIGAGVEDGAPAEAAPAPRAHEDEESGPRWF